MLSSTRKRDSTLGELTTIGFKPGDSPLHQLDPRTKQLVLMILSVATLRGDVPFLLLTSTVMILLSRSANLRIRRFFLEIRYFLLFLSFVFVIRAVSFNDQLFPVITLDEAKVALIICCRLLLVVFMGMLLMSTTRTADIRAALIWGMKPLPFVNERITATMVGLVVRFLPLVLFQANEIGDAMRARGIERRKNPLVRLIRFTITLFRRVFLRADDLVDTMQARCYSEYRTLPELSFSKNDIIAMGVGILLLLSTYIPWEALQQFF